VTAPHDDPPLHDAPGYLRGAVRITVTVLMLAVGAWLFADGLRTPHDGLGTPGSSTNRAAVESAWSAHAPLVQKGGFQLGGSVDVRPDPTSSTRSIVTLHLTNPYPDVARLHADVRAGSCSHFEFGSDGHADYELTPIDDGIHSTTRVDAATSTLTGAGNIVAVLATDDDTVYACADLTPRDPVLAASAQSVTSVDRNCETYLQGLTDAQLTALNPSDLPSGRCRSQAVETITASDRRSLNVRSYGPGSALRALDDLHDCYEAAGITVPPVGLNAEGIAMLLTGMARRDARWPAISARCDREHPLPRPLGGAAQGAG
jgi:hypothetical protein